MEYGVAAVVVGNVAGPVMCSRVLLLLLVAREVVLAFSGDEADLGRSKSEEISTVTADAGFTAS